MLRLIWTVCLAGESGPMNYSLPGSSVDEIFQASILEWVAIPYSRDLPNPGIKPAAFASPALAGRFFTTSLRVVNTFFITQVRDFKHRMYAVFGPRDIWL